MGNVNLLPLNCGLGVSTLQFLPDFLPAPAYSPAVALDSAPAAVTGRGGAWYPLRHRMGRRTRAGAGCARPAIPSARRAEASGRGTRRQSGE